MGRPSKDETPKVELKGQSFSVAKNPLNGHWVLVRIKYDFATGTVGEVETLSEGDTKSIALERFKIESARTLFRDGE